MMGLKSRVSRGLKKEMRNGLGQITILMYQARELSFILGKLRAMEVY